MDKFAKTDNIKKGTLLLKHALKKYEKGDIEGGDKDRELANELFDKQEASTKLSFTEDDNIALYGENRNFGVIYHVFKENAKKILKENKNRRALKDIVTFIKNNPLLMEQFNCYNAFNKKQINSDVDSYMNEAISFLPSFNKKEIIKINDKLIEQFRKYNLDESVQIDDDVIKLYETIEFFMLNKKNLSNLDEYNTNKNLLRECILSNKTQIENKLTESDYKKELTQLINKHQTSLNEDEAELINEINENDKKEVFEKYKNETLKFISEQIQNCQEINEKIDWANISTKVSIKQFDENKIFEDITAFIAIKNIIEE